MAVESMDLEPSGAESIGDGYLGFDVTGSVAAGDRSVPIAISLAVGREDRAMVFGFRSAFGSDEPSTETSEIVGQVLDAVVG